MAQHARRRHMDTVDAVGPYTCKKIRGADLSVCRAAKRNSSQNVKTSRKT